MAGAVAVAEPLASIEAVAPEEVLFEDDVLDVVELLPDMVELLLDVVEVVEFDEVVELPEDEAGFKKLSRSTNAWELPAV